MNIDRMTASVPRPAPASGAQRLDMTVSDGRIHSTVASAAAPAPAVASFQVASTPDLQQVLTAAESRALQDAFGDLAVRAQSPAAQMDAGLYRATGNRLRPPSAGSVGGTLDISG